MNYKNKRASLEMGVGTIVTIVLLVTVLILGAALIQNIFKSAKGVVDLTDQQLRGELDKLFSEEQQITIYPSTRLVEIKQDNIDGIGIGIKNLLTGSGTKKFAYKVEVSDPKINQKCGVDSREAESWIVSGQEEKGIIIPSGDFSIQKVLFNIPVGSPLCVIRFRVNVDVDGSPYGTDFFDISTKGK